MLKRFYFDLVKRETILVDETGIEAADLDEAEEQAEVALQELHDSEEVANFDDGWQLAIRDETGAVLRKLPVR
ncbi:DUF6894 family protein [Methylobacterium oxalidis]|uniref:DUF6894 domain-containing protein n=1 Tax=Methylobacterium oxalidis TaxID=944322 RepID=A0A512IZB8_9HYPH|nr:hypothetical protein [Methylobacterium oxalidis]GEP03057.1 hypothetical protein MOX02_10950 [Methylobacterium oxalidis]GJE32825.1 hypothetical protein LDDCCGHA_3019 [Methylobacterium oxalidis]GLS67316.1 hypothetical protein GCM10007888_57000 [Methylobacterium oxalidis]